MGTFDATLSGLTNKLSEYSITWSILGSEETSIYYEGDKLSLPTEPNPATLGLAEGFVFMGWSADQVVASDGVGFTPVVAGGDITTDATYYAVFAYRTGDAGTEKTVTLENSTITGDFSWAYTGTNKTLEDDEGNAWTFSGTYHQNKGGLQLGQKSGIGKTPEFSDNIKSIKFNLSGGDSRYLQLKSGETNVGELTAIPSGTKDYTFNIVGNYKQLDFVNYGSNGNYSTSNYAINIYSIEVTYGSPETYEYSGYTTGTINISKAGWATACVPFKATVTGAEAYYVTVDGDKLAKTEAKVIPAGAGVLLKGEEGVATTATFTISTGTADTEANMMKGSLEGETFNKTGYKYYILAKDNENGLGFYYDGADNTTGSTAECAAGKAVLAVPTGSSAKSFFSLFDEADGIKEINNVQKQDAQYNLSGVRVNGNYKGIVIINGKKVVK